jgi:hypothetical protein
MEMESVDSSNIREIGYDEAEKTLGIIFHSGILYHYFEVTPETFEEFKTADSLGKYFNANIRNQYDFTNMGPV